MDLNYIFKTFQELGNTEARIAYLNQLRNMNLPYDINYDNLIAAWQKKNKK
jgi:hypothetical protein